MQIRLRTTKRIKRLLIKAVKGKNLKRGSRNWYIELKARIIIKAKMSKRKVKSRKDLRRNTKRKVRQDLNLNTE